MSQDLVTFANTLPQSADELEAGLKNLQTTVQGGTGGIPFLRLLKSGVYAYGAENIEPEEGSEWAINPYSLMHGFACWGDGEMLDERMVPFTQAPPPRSELPDLGWEWTQQVSMHLQCLNGEDEGVTVLYKGTSTGLRNAVKELTTALIGQLQKTKTDIVPVIELLADSYQHKKYGEIFYPVLSVVKWLSMEGAEAPEAEATEPEAEPEEAPKPNRRRRRAKAPAEEAEPEKPASNRRRRRRQAS